jgi:hypothetical protein
MNSFLRGYKIMEKYTLISLGDHCAIPAILRDLGFRKHSYPFDWVSNREQVHDTNLMYNFEITNKLLETGDVHGARVSYIGTETLGDDKVNKDNNIWFPHDTENTDSVHEKYERRFERLYLSIKSETPCLFFMLTRYKYIDQPDFNKIFHTLMKYNSGNKFIFISGSEHKYLEDEKYLGIVFYKFIHYDISKFYDYDYHVFRPEIIKFIKEMNEQPI